MRRRGKWWQNKVLEGRQSLDTFRAHIDDTDNHEIQGYCEHLCSLRKLVIHEQYNKGKQFKLDTFFKCRTTPTVARLMILILMLQVTQTCFWAESLYRQLLSAHHHHSPAPVWALLQMAPAVLQWNTSFFHGYNSFSLYFHYFNLLTLKHCTSMDCSHQKTTLPQISLLMQGSTVQTYYFANMFCNVMSLWSCIRGVAWLN